MNVVFATGMPELNNSLLASFSNMVKASEIFELSDLRGQVNDSTDMVIVSGFLGSEEAVADELVALRHRNGSCRVILIMAAMDEEFRKGLVALKIYDVIEPDTDGQLDEQEIFHVIKNPMCEADLINKICLNIKPKENGIRILEISRDLMPKIPPISLRRSVKAEDLRPVNMPLIIGVGAVEPCIGSTYHALLLSNWLSKRGKVVLVEYNKRPALHLIGNSYADNFDIGKIQVHRVDVTRGGLNYSRFDGCNFIILDFGALKTMNEEGVLKCEDTYYEMTRTNCKILIGSSAPWRIGKTVAFNYINDDLSTWNILLTGGGESEIKRIREVLAPYYNPDHMYSSPYSNSPQSLDGHETLFEDILKKCARVKGGIFKRL